MPRHRVLIADDHALILNAVENTLQPHYDVVAAVGGGCQAVASAREFQPEVVVLDVTMPDMNGFDAARLIREQQPGIRIIFLSMHTSPIFLRKAKEVGAQGYVLKSGIIEDLTTAMRQVLDGGFFVSPGLDPQQDQLTERQLDVLRLVAQGKLNKQIAHELGISSKTVEFHRARMTAALKARSTADMVRVAIEKGFLP